MNTNIFEEVTKGSLQLKKQNCNGSYDQSQK